MIENRSPGRTATPHGALHDLFDAVVILKGLNGLAEIAVGVGLFLLRTGTIMQWAIWLTRGELLEDPQDRLALLLREWANGFGHEAQVFAGIYLLAHGVVKLLLAIFLFLEKTWAFPLALALFSVLVSYSFYRLSLHWSWPLAGFAALDILTIGLIAREWKALLASRA